MDGKVRTSWFLDEDTIRRVRGEAGLSGRTQSAVVEAAIREYLARNGTRTPPRPERTGKANRIT